MKYFLSLIILCFFTFSCTIFKKTIKADGEIYFEKFESEGTLGFLLEEKFEDILIECGVMKLFTNGANLSSIPIEIIRKIDTDQAIRIIKDESAIRMLSFVYDEKNIESFFDNPESLNDVRYITSPLLNVNNIPSQAEGSSSLNYYLDCNSLIDFALKAGAKLPTSSLEAAIQSSFDKQTSVIIHEGRFSSEFTKSINSQNFNVNLPSLLEIWKWYINNTDRLESDNYLLNSYRGIAFLNILEQAKDRQIDASLISGLGSLELESNLYNGVQSKLNYQGFSTIIYSNENAQSFFTSTSFDKLKTPKEIVENFSKAPSKLIGNQSPILTQGLPLLLDFNVNGIPSDLCEKVDWPGLEIDNQFFNNQITLSSITPISNSTVSNICQFQFKISPIQNIDNAERFLLGITLIGDTEIEWDQNIYNLQLNFNLELLTNEFPKIRSTQFSFAPEHNEQVNELIWQPELIINDRNDIIDKSVEPVLASSTLTCEDNQLDKEIEITNYTIADGNFKLRVRSPLIIGDYELLNEYDICQLSAQILLENKNNEKIQRPVNIDLLYPVLRRSTPNFSRNNIQPIDLYSIFESESIDISISETISAQFNFNDKKLANNTFAKAYKLSLSENDNLTIIMKSNTIDSYLWLVGPNGFYLSNDDYLEQQLQSDSNLNEVDSVIRTNIPFDGDYLIIANQFELQVGGFTLYTKREAD